jgi:hypothetical protein
MFVNDKRKIIGGTPFVNLKVGDVYEDSEGVICIKTSDNDIDTNCICYVDNEWEANYEEVTTNVWPLRATISVEGRV